MAGFILIFTVSAPGQLLLSIVWAQYIPPLLILMVGVLSPVLQDTEENPFPGFRTYVCPWQMAVSGLRLVVLMGKIPRLTVSLA
jgi:hypothetical protein